MYNIKRVSIPIPCRQGEWNNMAATTQGRHCDTCCKTVVDFTVMSNQQIIDTLSASDKICGRFTRVQLDVLNQPTAAQKTVQHLWKKWAVAAAVLLCSIPVYKADAKIKPVITLQPVKKSNLAKLITSTDSITYITITGKVTAKDDGLPLQGASVFVPDTKLRTQTSVNGRFSLIIPSTVKKFKVAFIGFEAEDIKVKLNPDHNYKIALKTSNTLMGEVVIERP